MYSKEKILETGYFIDNEYFEKYYNILLNEGHTIKPIDVQSDQHHIIPRHYYMHNNMDVDNSKDNKIFLSLKNHMVAHLYMSGCTTGQNKYWNLYAVYQMSGRDKDAFSLSYIEKIEDFDKLRFEAVSAAPNHRKGSKVSEETLEKMKNASRARCEKYGPINKGTVWVHNSEKDYMIPKEDLQLYLEQGYVKGRLFRHSDETKAKLAESSRNIVRGEDFCKKMSEIAKKQHHSRESIEKGAAKLRVKYKGSGNPFYGKKHSEEAKEKNRRAHLNKVWITNDIDNMFVFKEDVDKYLQEGYKFGRTVPKRK